MSARLAVIGTGTWGINHVRVAATHPGCELSAVVDVDTEAAARAASVAPHAAILRDPDAVLANPSIDGVIIATPSHSHIELAAAALAAGKHVLVEKPLALSRADAHKLHVPPSRVLLVGHLMVYHPAVVRMRELLHRGQLGRLQYIHSVRASVGRIRSDESVLWSFGPHDLSMLDFLLERLPISVTARGQAFHHDGVHDVAFVTMRYADGELAELRLSRIHPRKERTLTLVGSQQLVQFDDVATDKLRIATKGYDRPPAFADFADFLAIRDGDVHIPRLPMAEPLRLQLDHFIDCITAGVSPRADLASALRIHSVLEAAQQSLLQDGRPVHVNADDRRNH